MKIQHHKQQRSSKRNVCSTDQKTQQKWSPVGLHLNHLSFIISYFFVDEECAENWRKLTTIRTGFPNAFQAVVVLISQTAWSGLCVYDSCISQGRFLGWFFGRKRSTYKRVNTVLKLPQYQLISQRHEAYIRMNQLKKVKIDGKQWLVET